MVEVLDELQLTELVCSIVGLSALGGASILAETGRPDPLRQRPRSGQTRRSRATGEEQRHLQRSDEADRARTARTTHGYLAGGLGSPKGQPCLCREVHPPAQ